VEFPHDVFALDKKIIAQPRSAGIGEGGKPCFSGRTFRISPLPGAAAAMIGMHPIKGAVEIGAALAASVADDRPGSEFVIAARGKIILRREHARGDWDCRQLDRHELSQ
jgi:hypothetical protein